MSHHLKGRLPLLVVSWVKTHTGVANLPCNSLVVSPWTTNPTRFDPVWWMQSANQLQLTDNQRYLTSPSAHTIETHTLVIRSIYWGNKVSNFLYQRVKWKEIRDTVAQGPAQGEVVGIQPKQIEFGQSGHHQHEPQHSLLRRMWLALQGQTCGLDKHLQITTPRW